MSTITTIATFTTRHGHVDLRRIVDTKAGRIGYALIGRDGDGYAYACDPSTNDSDAAIKCVDALQTFAAVRCHFDDTTDVSIFDYMDSIDLSVYRAVGDVISDLYCDFVM